MMKLRSKIEPHTVFGIACNNIEVNVLYIKPNTLSLCQILLRETEDGQAPCNLQYEMTEEEYALWGTDDNYVMTWALAKLASLPHPHIITLIPEPEPEEEESEENPS